MCEDADWPWFSLSELKLQFQFSFKYNQNLTKLKSKIKYIVDIDANVFYSSLNRINCDSIWEVYNKFEMPQKLIIYII